MRKVIPTLSFCLAILFMNPGNSSAQQADRFAYAITDVQPTGSNWSFLRKLNLRTGEYSPVLLDGSNAALPAYNAATKKQLETPFSDARFGTVANAAFGNGVAAMAYDKKSNRLYYTPLLFDQLRYIDLKTLKVFFVLDKGFTGKPVKSADQGNIVTRMTIASDGNGYALTNDATQLVRFSTGRKLVTEDLGSLVDDPANKGISIHNSCSSFGGDMIADDNGNLYVFSARNHVFKVDLSTKVATHLGMISGLPGNFTVNGAAVDADNRIVVSSATMPEYFTVDYRNWSASPYAITGSSWNSSDLANSNLLVSHEKNTNTVNFVSRNPAPGSADSKISLYPNPVTNNQFVMQFSQLEPGSYTIRVTDVMGRQVLQQSLSISGESHTELLKLDPAAAKGIYLIKVTGQNSQEMYHTKIVVQ
ncbi:MAG: T9SS type A sorting domain-containing protein [Sphingobacteriales bacterium]|nr:T9SS type A sorting domain-containing protein [Sphingobacteriales bacterium]